MGADVLHDFLRFANAVLTHRSHPVAHAFFAALGGAAVTFLLSLAHQNSAWAQLIWTFGPLLMSALYCVESEVLGRTLLEGVTARQLLIVAACTLHAFVRVWGAVEHRRLALQFGTGAATGMRRRDPALDRLSVALCPTSGGRGGAAKWACWWLLTSPLLVHAGQCLVLFLGCVPLYFALVIHPRGGQRPFTLAVDGAAAAVTFGGVLLQLLAGTQLDAWLEVEALEAQEAASAGVPPPVRTPCTLGVWGAGVAHPDVVGHSLFWAGLGLQGVAALPQGALTLVGPTAVIAALWLVDVPLREGGKERGARAAPVPVPPPRPARGGKRGRAVR